MKNFLIFLLGFFPLLLFSQDLTGEWTCDDGGKYYLRQVNNELWWYGDGGTTWRNVFHGTKQGNNISGKWADVPSGKDTRFGSMTLQIVSSNELKRTKTTGGFGGSHWRRKGSGTGITGGNNDCFKLFSASAIPGYNKKTLTIDLEGCKLECKKFDWCKSFDYSVKGNKCYLQNADVSDVGKLSSNKSYDHYQNLCWNGNTGTGNTGVSDDCYTFYPNSAISGHNKKVLYKTDLNVCKTECKKYSWCKSFDYDPKAQKCLLQDVDISDVGKLGSGANKYDHYQRICW